jgi:hypothetical protein
MIKKLLRRALGVIDEEQVRQIVNDSPRLGDDAIRDDACAKEEVRSQLDKAAETLYRFEMQRAISRRRY